MRRSGTGAFRVIEVHPIPDDMPGLEAVADFFQIDDLLLQASRKTLDEDIVKGALAPVH